MPVIARMARSYRAPPTLQVRMSTTAPHAPGQYLLGGMGGKGEGAQAGASPFCSESESPS